MSDVIAFLAIVVSVLTARFSLVSARKTEKRQQTFELRFYQLSMLDPAKGTLQRILADINRSMNAGVLMKGELSPQDFEKLGKLDQEAVNTFHAISHHLPRAGRDALDAKRTEIEHKWMQQKPFGATFVQDSHAYVEELLQAVEDRLQALLNNA